MRRHTDRTALAFAFALCVAATGCYDDVQGSQGSNGAGGGDGSTASPSGGGAAGSGDTLSLAGPGHVTAGPTLAPRQMQFTETVAGGGHAKSKGHEIIFSFGEPTQLPGSMKSSNHQMESSLVGATGSMK